MDAKTSKMTQRDCWVDIRLCVLKDIDIKTSSMREEQEMLLVRRAKTVERARLFRAELVDLR